MCRFQLELVMRISASCRARRTSVTSFVSASCQVPLCWTCQAILVDRCGMFWRRGNVTPPPFAFPPPQSVGVVVRWAAQYRVSLCQGKYFSGIQIRSIGLYIETAACRLLLATPTMVQPSGNVSSARRFRNRLEKSGLQNVAAVF